MRKTTLLLLLLISGAAFAQNNYTGYYHLTRKARQYNHEGKYDSAFATYQQAFSMVEYVHDRNLFAAAQLAKKLKKKPEAHAYKQQQKSHRAAWNRSYKKIIDSLSREDQRVRGDKYYKAWQLYSAAINDSLSDKNSPDFREAQSLAKESDRVDSSNIALLKQLIRLYGFPSEKRVGSYSELIAFSIILHYDDDSTNAIMKPILDSALYAGDISPENYAWIVDRRLLWDQHKPAWYYQWPTGVEKLSKEELAEVDRRRYLIGLGGVYEGRKITVKDGITTITYEY
jgi:hypothetical protein